MHGQQRGRCGVGADPACSGHAPSKLPLDDKPHRAIIWRDKKNSAPPKKRCKFLRGLLFSVVSVALTHLATSSLPTLHQRPMKEQSLSPFLEQPSRLETSQAYAHEKIVRLEFELGALKREKNLVEQSRDATVDKYERLLASKNKELAQLRTNFDYVSALCKDLEKELTSVKGTSSEETRNGARELVVLRKENKQYRVKLQQTERLYQTAKDQYERVNADINSERSRADKYHQRLDLLQLEVKKEKKLNADLLEQLLLSSHAMGDSRELEHLRATIAALQKTINDLQCRVDTCTQQRTSVELLRQKNASLAAQVLLLEGTKERVTRVEQKYAALQAKFDEYFGAISVSLDALDADNAAVKDFVLRYMAMQNEHLVMYDKLNAEQTRVKQLDAGLAQGRQEYDAVLLQLRALETRDVENCAKIASLSKNAVLNQKEIEFLRNSVKDLGTSDAKAVGALAAEPASAELNAYLTNLEKLVESYKREIDALNKIAASANASVGQPSKRPRLIENLDPHTETVSALRSSNLELQTEVKLLQNTVRTLEKRLNSQPERAGAILELRENPFSADQLVKRETLEALRAENRDLITRFIENENVDQVPHAVYARQEHDKNMLQDRVDALVKKIHRIDVVYAQKTSEIMALISRYFGYSIKFIANPVNPIDICSKIKLVSTYTSAPDDGETPYLLLDVNKRTLGAHGSADFKRLCEQLVDQWVRGTYQIPCFLSAFNLEMYTQRQKRA